VTKLIFKNCFDIFHKDANSGSVLLGYEKRGLFVRSWAKWNSSICKSPCHSAYGSVSFVNII